MVGSSKKRSSFLDFDPEYEDAGYILKKTNCKTPLSGREHYVGLASIKSEEAETDEKYLGKKVDRASLNFHNDEPGSYSCLSEDESLENRFEYSPDSGIEMEASNNMLDQLRKIQDEEKENIRVLTLRGSNETEKAKHTKNQYVLWDKILDVRAQMQPLLININRLPSISEVLAFDGVKSLKEEKESLLGSLENTITGLLDLQEHLVGQDRIFSKMPKLSSEDSWKRSQALEKALQPFFEESLEKWHQKIILTGSDSSTKKKLRVINHGVWQQVQLAMKDQERLVARTQILRSGKRRVACVEDVLDGSMNTFPDLFDDSDFYQFLMKEWLEANPTRSQDSNLIVKSVQRGKATVAKIDQKASKGRKLRYDTHQKLVNYMVPMNCGPVPWNDEKISELYASLLAN